MVGGGIHTEHKSPITGNINNDLIYLYKWIYLNICNAPNVKAQSALTSLSPWTWSPSRPRCCYHRHKAQELLLCLAHKDDALFQKSSWDEAVFFAKFKRWTESFVMPLLLTGSMIISMKTKQGFFALISIPLSARPTSWKGYFFCVVLFLKKLIIK